jgi:hypothetical protein
MKAFIALLVIALIGFNVYNYMQVQDLKQQVARLEVKLNEEKSQGLSDKVVADAVRTLAQARDAVTRMDTTTARNYVENARTALERAGQTASEKAAPTVKWLGEQASDLGKKLQNRK